ncbi:unnamed protein product [Clonostachys rhizophaga]|uniref:Uncharacterized protein n=1 Tax=Clonostachys rhizophaga TaxID=160324 RepID=A0A9N9V780_9HYPO|nr:unnamed protein product [Clonostachys rhizophaga]
MALNVTLKVAIVTGAGSGINYSFAKLLLENKCNAILADLAFRPEAAELVSSYSDGNTTPRTIFMLVDVTNWKQLEEMFELAENEFGHADIICPGAGVFEPTTSNFWIPPGTGSSSDLPQKNRIRHSISICRTLFDHAISGFVRSLAALEQPPNSNVPPIRVAAVAPGIVKTHPYGLRAKKIQWLNSEKDQWVTPEEVADVMLSLIWTDNYKGGMTWK